MFQKIIVFFNLLVMFFTNLMGCNVQYKLNIAKLEKNVKSSNEARLESGTITGAHCLVMQNSEVVLNEVYGLDGVGGSPLSENAVYRIASMTKPVTAVALLIEQDRGHLNINDDLSKYLPEFSEMYVAKKNASGEIVYGENGLAQKGEKAVNTVKLYQLVSHCSGIGEVYTTYAGGESTTVDSASDWLSTQPLNFEPGTDFVYSTGAFDVAARVIEKTSGMEFAQYLKINIFDKLEMTDTGFEPSADQWARMVEIHNMIDGKACNQPTGDKCVFGSFPCTYHAAGAGLFSTTYDYAKFAMMLLNDGVGENGLRVLSAEAVKQLHTPVTQGTGLEDTRWGLAVCVCTGKSANLPAGSYFWSGAYGSHFWIDPNNNIIAVYMKNSAYDGGAGNKSATEFETDVVASLMPDLFAKLK